MSGSPATDRPAAARRLLLTAGLLAACLLLAIGCGRKAADEPPAPLPPPISEPEARRGAEACQAYLTRVCACARARPESAELAEQCELAPAKVSSLDMVLEVNQTSGDPGERLRTERTARRIAASCFDEESKLDSRGCAR